MLRRFYIENIALIDALELTFGEGFNVLTGETGAGKFIIIDAVNFVLGERASKELIKFGAAKARVEAVFQVKDDSEAARMLAWSSVHGLSLLLLGPLAFLSRRERTAMVNDTLDQIGRGLVAGELPTRPG